MASKNNSSSSSLSNSKSQTRMTCLCSPTTHPGSFRCSQHRNSIKRPGGSSRRRARVVPVSSNNWELSTVAKANSIKALLLQMIKPSSHDLRRRRNFQPKPSRFCLLNGNGNSFGIAVL
ncbi:hypothetical protein CCACVL1_21568 [Corchorus capsularis]|uniref:Serine-rich protein-like protein n=1 Tax=Corchorus capsularis TaxID=210143 RepID=A0A1R3H4L0_COCAP|nr:hypothetical protein CCACVL1_21568 [Corchorus capsularis]